MNAPFPIVAGRRAIIDRAEVAETIAACVEDGGDVRPAVLAVLRDAMAHGRAALSQRLAERPHAGHEITAGHAFLVDQLVRLIHDHVVSHVYPVSNRSAGERLAIMAVGGYGRAEMAPHSDVDIAFLTPIRKTSWCEQVIEAMLYFLWDLGFKVGHSSRSLDELVRMARSDLTIRTSLLEGRYVWGDEALYDEASARFRSEVMQGNTRAFVIDKLAERDERHRRMGDSRYVVEPNVKDGKGGLRDLHTLYWIGKFAFQVRRAAELVEMGLFSPAEYRAFRRAENFFCAVRCHLHEITDRAEDRLTFDLQTEVARRMRFAERPGKSSVERFMQFYFLNAKRVGSLTGVFLAQLEEKFSARGGLRFLPRLTRKPRRLKGFLLKGGKIAAPSDEWFQEDPVRLVELFQLADLVGVEVHPDTMRMAARDAGLIDQKVRRDRRANALFLDVLTSPRDPETVLRWMNEATVFGRFVPDFGRVVAQMQFDMYHHYTVDEHTIRAIGLLARIERGELADDHPLATAIMRKLSSRRVLYVAVLLHDIAKGRRGDHSVLGAEVALKLCPRLGLDQSETELVAWLVRYHLLMSATAFKRDLADYKTISDFVAQVQGLERLRLLLALTVVDIRAVGPGVWNSWKRQLLSTLFDSAEELLRLGHKEHGRAERIAAKKVELGARLSVTDTALSKRTRAFTDAYWIAEPVDIIARNLAQMEEADGPLSVEAVPDDERGATLVSVYAADHPGLFYRIVGGIHVAGGNIIDARIHTLKTGMAMDNFLVQDVTGGPLAEEGQIARLRTSIADALANRTRLVPRLDARPLPRPRAGAFAVNPRVVFDNKASNRFTVIEVSALDRPALLNRLAYTLFEGKLIVHSAHVATYGERAVDTFYVTDLLGGKVDSASRLKTLERKLVAATSPDLAAREAA